MNDRFLAIIPARGGSKGIAFKNLRELGGIPLIGHTIRAALKAARIDQIVVSTDSAEIAECATRFGVKTTRLRPPHLAEDATPSIDVVIHEVMIHAQNTGDLFEHVLLLQPTSPLRMSWHIDEAITSYLDAGVSSLISVCDVGAYHPAYMYRVREAVLEKFVNDEGGAGRRQDFERLYLRNGAIYIANVVNLKKTGLLVCTHPAFYVMDRKYSINIDEPEDLIMAEALLSLVS